MKKILIAIPFFVAMMTACSSDESTLEGQVIPETPVNNIPTLKPENANWELTTNLALTAEEKEVLQNFKQFSYDMMLKVDELTEGEYSCSPVSASIFMSMLANAAGGESRNEVMTALHVDDMESLNSTNSKLLHYLPCEENGACLKIANRYWVADRHSVNHEFESTMLNTFNGVVESVDFSNPVTVPAINKWVSDNTNGLITSILDGNWRDFINLEMTCANTVYFKGNWTKKFSPSQTHAKLFHGTKGDKSTQMMLQEFDTKYSCDDNFQLVIKDFEGHNNRLELYLPNKDMDASLMTKLLTPEKQDKLYSSAELYNVKLTLPKYSSADVFKFDEVARSLGINTRSVDLSSMGLLLLPISALQKTSIKWDEEGAELAAVTGGMIGTNLGEVKKSATVTYDRPFIYIIRNNKSGMILMAGTVCNVK